MINKELKPIEKQVIFTEPTETTGRLQITISIYDEPVMTTPEIDIHTVIDIKEDFGGEYIPFGQWLYQNPFTEKKIKEAFELIKSNPIKYKNKSNGKEGNTKINN